MEFVEFLRMCFYAVRAIIDLQYYHSLLSQFLKDVTSSSPTFKKYADLARFVLRHSIDVARRIIQDERNAASTEVSQRTIQNGARYFNSSCTTQCTPSVKWDNNWDKRDVSCQVRRENGCAGVDGRQCIFKSDQIIKPTATRNLFLIRHGQYKKKGKTDKLMKLTSLGRCQAKLTAKRLKNLNFEYTLLTSSTMTRAEETASIIQRYLKSVPKSSSKLLCDGHPVPAEPPSENLKPEHEYYVTGARIEAGFKKYFHRASSTQVEDSYEILVCHSNVICYFVCRALQLPAEAWKRFTLHNGSITWIVILPSGEVHLNCFGEYGHMPPDKISRS